MKKLTIGVHLSKPLVTKDDVSWSGFEMELWKKIATSLKIPYEIVQEDELGILLKKTQQGIYSMAMAGISRTVERSKNLSFSFFTLETGLTIASKPSLSFSFSDFIKSIFSKQVIAIFIALLGFSFITAHIYWLIEKGLSVSTTYAVGILESFWWSIVTFSTVGYGDISPISIGGKIFGLVAIIIGLIIFGLYIAQLSSSLTVERIRSRIKSADDLQGNRIGVKSNTTSVDVVTSYGGIVYPFASIEACYDALNKGLIDAIVADAPVLQTDARQYNLLLIGGIFERQTYTYIFPKAEDNQELIKKINIGIIQLQENGSYDALYKQYFGN